MATKKPLLTVCVITYNHRQYIQECLDTILMQQVDFPWQIVVADDCSTDGTREILQEYKDKYPDLIHLILQKENVGPERNWLDLLSYPKSKYMLYTEGDDYFTDTSKLRRQVEFLEKHPDFSICFHPVEVVYERQARPTEIFPTPKQRFHKKTPTTRDLVARNFMQTNSVMYLWRFVKQDVRRMFPAGIIPGDWFLHVLHAQIGKIGFLDRPMAVYRRHAGGLWWSAASGNIDKIWKKYGLGHLKLFVAMDELLGAGTYPMLQEHMREMYRVIAETDRKYKQHQLPVATQLFPDATAAYIQSATALYEKELANLKNHANEQSKIIAHQEGHIAKLEQQLRHPVKTAVQGRLKRRSN